MVARVLIVDDKASSLQAMTDVLIEEGYAIETATNAADAESKIHAAVEEYYDVILTDMHMEHDDSGLAVVKAAQETKPSIPAVVFTGYAEIEDSINSMKAGAFSYLAKRGEPGELDLLLLQVERAVDFRRSGQRRTAGKDVFDSLEGALKQLDAVQGMLKTVSAQMKSVADLQKRFLE
jgi:DNA-binding NtrC family response regulator